jgi:hypothetical protein
VYELNGTLINQLVVFNGKSTNPSQNNNLTQLNEAINLFSSKNNLTRRVPECSTIFFVNVIVYLRTDHYSYITVGTYTQKALQYSSYSTYNRIEPMNVPCGGSEESYANHYINEFREVIDEACSDGYIRDNNGNCIKKPCSGNPINNPEIASSGGSGKKGGTYGCTRSSPTRICGGVQGKKKHDGIDITATPNSNVHAMYSGTVVDLRNSFAPGQQQKDSYGNYVTIKSTINGQIVFLKFNHLNIVSVVKNQFLNVGDIMGLSGTTGNAGGKGIIPHIHIRALNANSSSIDPQNFLNTKFDANQNPINSTNCN